MDYLKILRSAVYLVMLGSMQTKSAKKFIDAALSLSDETQTEIFNMIRNPITKIQNNEKVTREDILDALKLVGPSNLTPNKSENSHYFNEASEDVQTFATSTPINIKKNSSNSSGINSCHSDKPPVRPTSLNVSNDNALMPPPSFTPTKSRQKTVTLESEKTSLPPASPLTPLRTLVESPHWNVKMRLHEAEQRARAAELRASRAEAEREDAEALSVELREQLAQTERRAHVAEVEVTRLRRDALQWQDNKDELVEARAELVLQAERIKTLEERLVESQARLNEANSNRKDLECHLTERDAKILALQQKVNEYKGREAYHIEVETMRSRLKEAEARLAEELRFREALEQDVLSQQSVVHQMKIDQRIAEKRSSQQNGYQQNGSGDLPDTSFDVSIAPITSNEPILSANGGENLGSIFHRELESALSKIQSLEVQLEEKRKSENRFVNESNELVMRNRSLEVQLSQFQEEYDKLKQLVQNHTDDVRTLKNTKLELEELKRSLSEIKMDKESLLQRLKLVESDRADLYCRLASAMEELKDSSSENQCKKETEKTADCVVEELRDYVAKLRLDHIDMEAAVVMAQESQAAAETARDHLLEDLGTLQANLASSPDDFSSSLSALLVPEVVSLANAFLNLFSQKRLADEKTAVSIEHVTQTDAEAAASASVENQIEVSVQTDLQEGAIESPIVVEQVGSSEMEQVQAHTIAVNEEELTQLKLCLTEERYREERALSARAHHLCELNEKEARRFHAIGERYRSAITAFLSRLESRGLVELLRREHGDADDAVSISYDIAQELNSVCSQLALSGDRLNEMRKENIRLKEDINYLREKLRKSRNMEEKIRYLAENSKYLESELERMLQKQSLSSRDEQQNPHNRISLTCRPTIEDAADTDDDSVAYTDLSQISSRPPYSPPHSSDNRQHTEPHQSPASSERQQKRRTNGGGQRCRGSHVANSSPPPPFHVQSVSSVREVSEPPPTYSNGPRNQSSADEPDRQEDMYSRLAELRRRNDLQPFHLRTNYPIETQLQSPTQFFTLLQTVHQNGIERHQQQRSHSSMESPAPAGFTLPPKGLQSISEVLLTGAKGIVGAEKLDLTSTRSRPTESAFEQITKEVAPSRRSNPPLKKEALAFEVKLSPPRRHRKPLPPSLSQRSVARSDDTSKPVVRSAISRGSSSNPFSVASSKARAKGWATPAAVAASNSRRPLNDTAGKLTQSTGIMKGLFTQNESNAEFIKDKDAKKAYLRKVIDFVTVANDSAPNVKISSIISGKDAERTNILLQLLAEIANRGVDNADCVNKALRVNRTISSIKPEANDNGKEQSSQILASTQLPVRKSGSESREIFFSRTRSSDRIPKKSQGKLNKESLDGVHYHSFTARPSSAQEPLKSQNEAIEVKLYKPQCNLGTEFISNCSSRESQVSK
nr:Protein CHMP7 [Hymenolepis microstoma]